ncbi:major outer membrane protein [Campylobacter sp. MG1]|uniref:major outer membrane protein n=1 Tax=Campylobacter sp. MG1 TaxID=2976332 RepID=UPI00226CF48F|nr:major outer membrane protein [Campylobacter sp. MG1]
MKLVKLSLAAVVAAGSFSFANAVALDEAIQNVDLSGYLRYRYDSKTTKRGDAKVRNDAQVHKYKAKLNFAADIADNFKANVGLLYGETGERSWKNTKDDEARANVGEGFAVQEAYLSYTNFDTTFQFGRLLVGSIWTDDLYANGLKVLNNSVEGLTLAAYVFDNYSDDEDFVFNDDKYKDIRDNNIYGIAAIGSFAPVDAQLWVAYMNKVGTFYALDLAANLGDKDDFAYRIHAQYAGNSLKGDLKDSLGAANGNFYGIEAGFDAFGADFNVGYIGYGKKGKLSVSSIEDQGQLMTAGEVAMDYKNTKYTASVGKKDFVFGTLGYTYADVRFGVDLVYGTNNNDKDVKEKYFEVVPRLSYKYSDKLSFSSFYSYTTIKNFDWKDGDKEKVKKIRLEAKYTF